jgi:hypothetical protein
MPLDVVRRSAEPVRVIPEAAEPAIAVPAEQVPQSSRLVIVIDMPVVARHWVTANLAVPVLPGDPRLILPLRELDALTTHVSAQYAEPAKFLVGSILDSAQLVLPLPALGIAISCPGLSAIRRKRIPA